MEKTELLELSKKLGIKPENFEFGYEKDKERLEKQVLDAAKFMGLI